MAWLAGLSVGLSSYVSQEMSENHETLCFVYTERTNKIVTAVASGLTIFPSNVLFIYVYIRIHRVIMEAVNICSR